MELYGGIDLHGNNNVIALLDEADSVVFRKRLSNDMGTIVAALGPYRKDIVGIAVKSTYASYHPLTH
jgi:transposase